MTEVFRTSGGRRGFADLIVYFVRDERHPTYIGRSSALGLVSGRLKLDRAMPLDEIAQLLEIVAANRQPFYENVPFDTAKGIIRDQRMMHEHLISSVHGAHDSSIYGALPRSLAGDVASLINDAVPKEAMDTLRRLENLHANLLHDALTFLSSGDIAARNQALRAFPMISEIMITSPDLQRKIDERGKLGNAVAATLDLDAPAFRIYSQIEKQVSSLAFAPASTKGLGHVLASFFRVRDFNLRHTVRKEGTDLLVMRDDAIAVARRCRLDQIPAPGVVDGTPRFDFGKTPVIRMLAAMDAYCALEARTSLGPMPFDRIIRRLSKDEWPTAQSEMKSQFRSMNGLQDYLDHLAHAVSNAIIVSRLRETPG